MKIYQVGPDVPYGLPEEEVFDECDQFEWVVFWYEDGVYDGFGEAVALSKDGLLYIKDLGHCSCYGPMDGGLESGVATTVEKFLERRDDIHSFARTEIEEKVSELLSQRTSVLIEKFLD